MLAGKVDAARVLDLFAGTGALGLEALSRGAASAVFVESDPVARAVLARNIETLGASGAETLFSDYRRAVKLLSAGGRRFDIVFLDPPYGLGMAAAAARALKTAHLLEPGAVVVVEEAAREPGGSFPEEWGTATARRYGDTRIALYTVPGEGSGQARD
jgi:16S rRNA (guanine966-N2)-methyltransferase